MGFVNAFILFLTLMASPVASAAGLFEREVVFSETQIQAALDKSRPLQLSYGGLASVALQEAPRIFLDRGDGQARIAAGLDFILPGKRPIRVDLAGRAGIRYDDQSKAFYLENPVAESVSSPSLRQEATPMVREAVTQLMSSYFRSKPVYVLRENGSPQEIAARWLLKSIRIEPGRVVAVLSTI